MTGAFNREIRSIMQLSHEFLVFASFAVVLFLQFGLLWKWSYVCSAYLAAMETMPRSVVGALPDEKLPNWFAWVQRSWKASPAGAVRQFRQQALSELDLELECRGIYVFIQRLAPLGPLLGVFLTSVAFMRLAASGLETDGKFDLTHLMQQSLQPVSYGMATGVVIALIHQLIVVHLAGLKVDKVRMRARDWLDAGFELHETERSLLLESVEISTSEVLDEISKLRTRLSTEWDALQTQSQELQSHSKQMQSEMATLKSSAEKANLATEQLKTETNKTFDRMDDIVTTIETTLDSRLEHFADSFSKTSQTLCDNVTNLDLQARDFMEASQSLLSGSQDFTNSLRAYSTTLDDSTAGHEELSKKMEMLTSQFGDLAGPLSRTAAFLQHTEQMILKGQTGFQTIQQELKLAVDRFSALVLDKFTPACEQHQSTIKASSIAIKNAAVIASEAAESWDSLKEEIQRIQTEAGQLGQWTGELSSVVEATHRVMKDLTQIAQPTFDQMRINQKSTGEILAKLHDGVSPIGPAVSDFSDATKLMTLTAQALLPLARSSRDLSDTMVRLEVRLRDLPGELRAASLPKARSGLFGVFSKTNGSSADDGSSDKNQLFPVKPK